MNETDKNILEAYKAIVENSCPLYSKLLKDKVSVMITFIKDEKVQSHLIDHVTLQKCKNSKVSLQKLIKELNAVYEKFKAL